MKFMNTSHLKKTYLGTYTHPASKSLRDGILFGKTFHVTGWMKLSNENAQRTDKLLCQQVGDEPIKHPN
jgi:hypothetical protein